MGAPAPRRRALGALHRITNVGSEFRCAYGVRRACGSEAGADSITRCRELLGEDAESMTDQDIVDIRRHAETMAFIVVEMYQEQCRVSE